jgi:hypothetical protein
MTAEFSKESDQGGLRLGVVSHLCDLSLLIQGN